VFQQHLVKLSDNRLSLANITTLLEKRDQGVHISEADEEVLRRGRQAALNMTGARKESMMMALEMLDSEFGGAEGYMREWCGLGDEDLEALRRNLIVEEES
jgi:hypothetical protein